MNSIQIRPILEILLGKLFFKKSSLKHSMLELEKATRSLAVEKRRRFRKPNAESLTLDNQIKSLNELKTIIKNFLNTHQIDDEQRRLLNSSLTAIFIDMVRKGELGACELEGYSSSYFRAADVTFIIRGKNGEILDKDKVAQLLDEDKFAQLRKKDKFAQLSDKDILAQLSYEDILAQLNDEDILADIRIYLCRRTAQGTFKAVFASKLQLQYKDGVWISTPISVNDQEALCITRPQARLPVLTEEQKNIRNKLIGRTPENPGIFDLSGATIEPFLRDVTAAKFLKNNLQHKIADQDQFNTKVGLNLMAEIASLHAEEGYLHSDINLGNIFITYQGEITLCDFNTLKVFKKPTGFQGSIGFTPSQLLNLYFEKGEILPSPMQDIYGSIIISLLLRENNNGELGKAFRNYLNDLRPLEEKLQRQKIPEAELKKIFSEIVTKADQFQQFLMTYLENSKEEIYHKAYLAALNDMNTTALDVVQLMLRETAAQTLLNSEPAMKERFEQLLTHAPSILAEEQVPTSINEIITHESMSTPPRMKNSQEDLQEARRASSEPVALPVTRKNFYECSQRPAVGRSSSLRTLVDCAPRSNEAVVKTEQSFFRKAVQNNSDSGVQQAPPRKVIKRATSLWAFSADSVSPNKEQSVVSTYKM